MQVSVGLHAVDFRDSGFIVAGGLGAAAGSEFEDDAGGGNYEVGDVGFLVRRLPAFCLFGMF